MKACHKGHRKVSAVRINSVSMYRNISSCGLFFFFFSPLSSIYLLSCLFRVVLNLLGAKKFVFRCRFTNSAHVSSTVMLFPLIRDKIARALIRAKTECRTREEKRNLIMPVKLKFSHNVCN